MKLFLGILITFLLFLSSNVYAQGLTKEQVSDTIRDMPSFSMYQDNFFISGVPLNDEISRQTADAKYQISFKQLVSRNTLPLDSYLFLTYTQTAFWNIYAQSSPFQEINFNPGINVGIPVFQKEKLLGMAFLKAEHMSNGRDSIYSRSWNKIVLSFRASLNEKTSISAEAWFPFDYKKDNPDILQYIGLGEINFTYEFIPEELSMDLMLQKGLNWEWKGALQTRLLYSPFKMKGHTFTVEWYYGHAESLLHYQEFRSMLRIGFLVKSDDLNFL